MHGVRRTMLEEQAAAVDVPLWQVPLPWPCSNDDYEARMAGACGRAVAEGFDTIAFGDLYLQDVRAYRERQLAGCGLRPIFPLWQLPTSQLARDMIAGGLRARLSCIDSGVLDADFAGRDFDSSLLADLPHLPTHAAKTASSTASSMRAPCSARRLQWRPARCATSTASFTRISCAPYRLANQQRH